MRLISLALLICASALAQLGSLSDPYIDRGKIELGFSGNVTIPHSNAGATSGNLQVDGGYYVSRHSLIGGEVGISGSSGAQTYALAGHYRYLFHTHNPKLFPFLGGSPGLGIAHLSSGNPLVGPQRSVTNTRFTFRGEAGLKYFVARNVSVEAAYNLHYVLNTNLGSLPGTSASASALVFGLAFTF